MSIELPLYGQQKDNTCALACLRMVLAVYGREVPESELETQARIEKKGTLIDDLECLAQQFGLVAEIQEATPADLQRILAEGRFPITYIDRAVFELPPRKRARHRLCDAQIHTVIPTRVTEASVIFHDPLPPRITRKSLRLFAFAHRRLGSYCVVCSRPGETAATGRGGPRP